MRKEITVKIMSEIKSEALRIAAIAVATSVLGLFNFVMWRVWSELYWVVETEPFTALTEVMADWHIVCGVFCVACTILAPLMALTYYYVCKLRSVNGVVVFEHLTTRE